MTDRPRGGFRAAFRRWWNPPRTIHFTKAGRNVVLLAFGIGFAAMNTGNNLLYIIFGLLLGMILASGFVSEGVLRPVRVSLLWPGEIFAGAPFPLRVIINNPSRRPLIGLQAWATVTPPGSVAAETPPAAFLYVPARSQAGRDIPLAASARGDLRLVHIRVGTLFPFGFFEKSLRVPFDEVRVVYPARVPVPRRALALESPSPRQRTDRRGAGDAFWGLRDFQEGDSPRRVAWKSAARLGRLIVRENERETEKRLLLDLGRAEDWRRLPPAERENAVSFTASLALLKWSEGYDVGLVEGTLVLPPGRAPRHRQSFLTRLARLDPLALETPAPAPGARSVLDLWRRPL